MTQYAKEDVEKKLLSVIQQLLIDSGEQERHIYLDDSLQHHIGLDSLGRAELFKRLEKTFNVTLPDKLLAEAETPNDILFYLLGNPKEIKSFKSSNITHHEIVKVNVEKVSNLIDLLLTFAEKEPNKSHIFFQKEDGSEEVITYGDLFSQSLRVANALREYGLKEKETVAIMQPTHLAFFYIFFGTLLAGGIPVPIYPPFRLQQLETYAKTESTILRNAEVRILVTFREANRLSHLLKVFVPSLKHVLTPEYLLKPSSDKTIYQAKSSDLALIQYTSGSTSDPKGVALTHANLLANIRAYGEAVKVKHNDVAVSWLPLYHDMGLIGMWLGSLFHGIPLILLAPFTFLNHPERWLWAIHYHHGTLSAAPNFAYELCIRKIDPEMIEGLNLSSWRLAANGAEKVYPETLENFAKKFAPYGFKREALLPVYGLAESAVALAIPEINQGFKIDRINRDQFEMKKIAEPYDGKNSIEFVCCGKPLKDHEIRIVNDEMQVLSERKVGNLQFRGPSSMQGYFNNAAATNAVFDQGWIKSGDLAYQVDGEFYITGRRKDLIIKAGRNIYPAEIEGLVSQVKGIRLGCVVAFGIENARGTEELIIVAETNEKNSEKRIHIIEKINETISNALSTSADKIILVKPHVIPKTSSGKLQRHATKLLYLKNKLEKSIRPTWLQLSKLSGKWIAQQCMAKLSLFARILYTAYMASLFFLSLVFMYLLIQFLSPYKTRRACQLWARFLLFVGGCRLEVVHPENAYKVWPVIFTANHASYIDAVAAIAVVPFDTRFVAKKELFVMPIIKTFLQKLETLAVDRIDLPKGIEDTKNIEHTLKTGNGIFIFPEGTFGYGVGLRPFRLGAFKIAVETNTPICPIAFKGTRLILRDDQKIMRLGKITATIIEPIKATGSDWQDVTQLRNEVRNQIANYCGEPTLDFITAQKVAPKQN